MRAAVRSGWLAFSSRYEGRLPFLYLDALGWVTTGEGNLADPVARAQSMPFLLADGSPASPDDIAQAWDAVDALRTAPKGQKQGGLAAKGGGAFGGVTSLRLTKDAIDAMVLAQLDADEANLRGYYPEWDSFPADAQAVALSMAWAMGSGELRVFTQFNERMNARDFAGAIAFADFRGTGVAQRIAANKAMLRNAAWVEAGGGDPERWYGPDFSPPTPDASGGGNPMMWALAFALAYLAARMVRHG